MLTDTQLDFIRALPVEIRLQLLHADPDGAGFYFKTWNRDEMLEAHSDASEAIHQNLHRYGDREKPQSHTWIPRNPLTILSVASDLYSQTARGRDCWPHAARAIGKRWVLYLMATDANGESRAVVSAEDVDPLAAAVEVLREVCRG